MTPEIRKYLEMFIAMSTDALLGKITPQTFAKNAQMASGQMLEILERNSAPAGQEVQG